MSAGRYAWDPQAGTKESFKLDSGGRLSVARSQSKVGWACEISFDPAWRVAELRINKTVDGRETSARYRWDGDAWAGELVTGGVRREVFVPMAGGLEILVPFPSFEGAFLRRIGLPPLSQRRVETVEVRLDDLEAVQSHCIIERLADASREKNGAQVPAACYRWTDEFGRQEFVWVDQEHVGLARADGLAAAPRYRLA